VLPPIHPQVVLIIVVLVVGLVLLLPLWTAQPGYSPIELAALVTATAALATALVPYRPLPKATLL
jgi:hypothetical protein